MAASSPSDAWLTNGNAGTTAGTNFIGTTDNVDLVFKTNNTEYMRITNGGWLGIGVTTPTTYIHITPPSVNNFDLELDVNNTTDAAARFYHTQTGNGNRVVFGITNYNGNTYQAPAVIGLHINSSNSASGGVGVQGTTNARSAIGVYAGNQNTIGSTTGWGLYSNNWSGGVTAWQNVSDERLKIKIKPIANALTIINNIRGVEYYFNDEAYPDLNLPTNKQYGFVAQEVEKVLPEIVRIARIPASQGELTPSMSQKYKFYDLKVMSYTYIVPILTQAIKEQQQQIEALKAEIEQLKANKK